MPIQFHCPHCEHRLRTPDDKAGLSAKCPACGERIDIPHAHEVAAEPTAADVESGGPIAEARDDRRPCPECGADNALASRECEFCGSSLRRRSGGGSRRAVTAAEIRGEVSPADLEIGRMMADAWTIYTRDMAPLLLGPFLFGLAVAAAMIPLVLCLGLSGPFLILLIFPLGWLVNAAAEIGLNFLYFKGARNSRPEIGDTFAAFGPAAGYLGPMFVFVMLYSLLTFLGFLLLILPGLYLAAVGWIIPRVLLDEGLDGTAAISRGWHIAHENLGTTLLVALLCAGLGLLASLVPFGGIFAMPYLSLICTVAYLRMTGQPVDLGPRD